MLYNINFTRKRHKNNDGEFVLVAVKFKIGHRKDEN